jgi:hypothetical protein
MHKKKYKCIYPLLIFIKIKKYKNTLTKTNMKDDITFIIIEEEYINLVLISNNK